MAEQPPNTEDPASPDFVIERGFDASKGFYDEHVIENVFYVGIECTSTTVDKIYYLPTDFPNLLTDVDQYWTVSGGIYYVDKSVSVEVYDVRVENQLKTTQNSTVPLEMSNIGIRFFDVEGDQMISDTVYPLADSDDWKIIQNLKLRSVNKLPSTLPTIDLYENSIYFNDAAGKPAPVRFTTVLNTRDPRFIERNNVAEATIYSSLWHNDIGLRKPIKYLLNDPYSIRKLKLAAVKGGAPCASYCDAGATAAILKANGIVDESWVVLNTYPVDYRFGHIQLPNCGLKRLIAASVKTSAGATRQNIKYPVQLSRMHWPNKAEEYPVGNLDVVYEAITPYNGDSYDPFNIEQNFDTYLT